MIIAFSNKNKGGVYKIVNIITSNCYVGSTVSFYNRRKTHFSKLNLKCNGNINLQKEFNLYGQNAFKFEILEVVDRTEKELSKFKIILNKKEQKWIDKLKPAYNVSKIAGSNLGNTHTKEAKRKIVVSQSLPINQYTLNGVFIREWESAAEAGDTLKINKSHIIGCCNGKRKTIGGFKWKKK